jgi:nucleotide-binding universal stress UspA family protein
MKILLAADGSIHSAKATSKLIQMLPSFKSKPELLLLNVHLPVPSVPNLGMFVGRKQIARYYREEGEKALRRCKRLLKTANIRYRAEILVGPVAETIVAQCHAQRCNMIFMGTRGAGALAGMLIGSTATKVLHLSDVPVVLVR